MKDKNYEGRSYRLSPIGKVLSVATALIFPVLLSGQAIAESDVVESPVTQESILQNPESGNLVPHSQPLSLEAAPVAVAKPTADSTVVDPAEVALSAAPTQLAMATVSNSNDISGVNAGNQQKAADDGSLQPAGGEASQKHYPLMLALLALISLVPMSRRHQ